MAEHIATIPIGLNGPEAALFQTAEIAGQALGIEIKPAKDGRSMHGVAKQRAGIQSLTGFLTDEGMILIELEVLRAPSTLHLAIDPLFHLLAELGDKVHLRPPQKDNNNGKIKYSVGLLVQAMSLSFARANALATEIKKIDELARKLQEEIPESMSDARLVELYKNMADVLAPVYPIKNPEASNLIWAEQTVEMLQAGLSIALVCENVVDEFYALALLASALAARSATLARFIPTLLPAKGLTELALKAPGIVAVQASRIQMGSNIYELGNEMAATLASLQQVNRSVIFSGSHSQLQSILHGGQGGINDPLLPVVCHVPKTTFASLLPFVIDWTAQQQGGLTAKEKERLQEKVQSQLTGQAESMQMRLVLPLTLLESRHRSVALSKAEPSSFIDRMAGLRETLSGLGSQPRGGRSPYVQQHFVQVLTDPGLFDAFCQQLFAQEEALQQIVERMQAECLTRPLHQPLRICFQGTPATGKSVTTVALSERLQVPYINIDAASIPDFYTASAQLLGSGRGIVGSHQAGRLEQAAKHHIGAVVEISDLDHAVPNVRAALADLFLQVLETGEAQSATGAMFSCANLIFIFTINLPDGMDETVRKGLGFNNEPTEIRVREKVSEQIKQTFSSAFLSRVGSPILFRPLTGESLALIVERTIDSAVRLGSERLHHPITTLQMAPGVGRAVLQTLQSSLVSYGARALIEHSRSVAARALLRWSATAAAGNGEVVVMVHDEELEIKNR